MYFVYTQWSLFQQLEIAGKQGNIGPAQISLAKLLCGKQNRDCVGAWRLFLGHLPDLLPRGNQERAEKPDVL